MSTEPEAGHRAEEREASEPTERGRPIPWIVAAISIAVVLAGAGYILLSGPLGSADLGDRRTSADLRPPVASAGRAADGQQIFTANCAACHQATGKGLPGVFPPLDGSEWVNGDGQVLARIVLYGVTGDISVSGVAYKGAMPSFAQLSDDELAAVLSHVRSAWSNRSAPLTADLIGKERKASPRTTPYTSGDEVKEEGMSAPAGEAS